jgi:hypothetical protein
MPLLKKKKSSGVSRAWARSLSTETHEDEAVIAGDEIHAAVVLPVDDTGLYVFIGEREQGGISRPQYLLGKKARHQF